MYVEPGKLDQAGFAMQCLKRAMRWDEERFGLELDLDRFMIVAVGDFNMGAMENKGLNIFNTKYVLARADTATDVDFMMIDRVVAHEYFHNWTGNRVTCRDWFQLSLKEGLTVFRDQEYGGDEYSRAVTRIQDVRDLRERQFPEDAGPMAHPGAPRVLRRDQQLLHGHRLREGRGGRAHVPDPARAARDSARGMDLYFERHDGQAVTCDDFRAAMADANGADLAQFGLWYSQAGTPVLESRGEYDARRGPTRSTLRAVLPARRRARRRSSRSTSRSPSAWWTREGYDMPLRLEGEESAYATADPKTGAITRVVSLTEARARRSSSSTWPGQPVPSILRGLLGAGDPAPRLRRRRAHAPDGVRRGPVQPLGGGPGARHAHPPGRRRGAARRPGP